MRPFALTSVCVLAMLGSFCRADDVANENRDLREQNLALQKAFDEARQNRLSHQNLIAALDHEMRVNTQFVRIHAAEALIAHGEAARVAEFISPEMGSTAPMYRIGIWRVMARAAAKEEDRRAFVEKIRHAMLDANGPDRGHAVESLCKLGEANPADRDYVLRWVATLDDAGAAFPRWLLVLSSSAQQRTADEENLAKLLNSKDGIARLRAAFALGRLTTLSASSAERLRQRLNVEAPDSPSRAYVIAAILLHTAKGSPEYMKLKTQLAAYLEKGRPNEQLLAGTVIGMRGTPEDLPRLAQMLKSPEADARIGAALGSLYLLK